MRNKALAKIEFFTCYTMMCVVSSMLKGLAIMQEGYIVSITINLLHNSAEEMKAELIKLHQQADDNAKYFLTKEDIA